MKILSLLALTVALTNSGLVACSSDPAVVIPPVAASGIQVKKAMKSFKSDDELLQYFRKLAEKQRLKRRRGAGGGGVDTATANAAPAAAPMMEQLGTEKAKADESVTNVQHQGVDEGGIVKVHGNHLVILRRGRLFTVAIGDGALKPISTLDAFGPEINPQGTWYDEMLVSDNTVVVIGYSYERGGTEVGLFEINNDGRLSYRSTYHLRSNDYYSSRNYASRLIGSKLIFYAPQYLHDLGNPFDSFPAVRRWHKGAKASEFQRVVAAHRVYRPETEFNVDFGTALHTVTVCDLARGGFDCQATTVIGPAGRVFYVSPDSVYVWASSWSYDGPEKPVVFRMPLDGSGPSALRASGSPVDQFSFLQSDDQHLNVLVRSEAKGDGMWAAEVAEGDVALMRIPIMTFSDGSEAVPASSYKRLPKPRGYTFHNRFISDYLIYGTGSGWGQPENADKSNLFIVNWRSGNSHQLPLPHGVDRIEQLGSDAVIVGTDGKEICISHR